MHGRRIFHHQFVRTTGPRSESHRCLQPRKWIWSWNRVCKNYRGRWATAQCENMSQMVSLSKQIFAKEWFKPKLRKPKKTIFVNPKNELRTLNLNFPKMRQALYVFPPCASVPGTASCCGEYPVIFPFKMLDNGSRDCCVKTIDGIGALFNPNVMQCCDDGVARFTCI